MKQRPCQVMKLRKILSTEKLLSQHPSPLNKIKNLKWNRGLWNDLQSCNLQFCQIGRAANPRKMVYMWKMSLLQAKSVSKRVPRRGSGLFCWFFLSNTLHYSYIWAKIQRKPCSILQSGNTAKGTPRHDESSKMIAKYHTVISKIYT